EGGRRRHGRHPPAGLAGAGGRVAGRSHPRADRRGDAAGFAHRLIRSGKKEARPCDAGAGFSLGDDGRYSRRLRMAWDSMSIRVTAITTMMTMAETARKLKAFMLSNRT